MTYYQQKGREYLDQVIDLEIRIRMLRYRLEEIFTEAEGLGVNLRERVQTSPTPDAMANAVVRLIKEQERTADAITECRELKQAIEDTIRALDDARYKDLLFSKYIEHKRLQVIADEMHYSLDHIKRLHRNALDELGRMLK